LRGFLEDVGAQVLASEPGMIRVRLGEPIAHEPKPKGGVLAWLGRMAMNDPPPAPPTPDPIEIELLLERPDSTTTQLHITATCRVVEPQSLRDTESWKHRCARIHHDLRAYLMAQEQR